MPTDTAELVISCRADGTANVNKFTDAVRQADGASNQLVKTLGGLFTSAAIMQFARVSIRAYSDLQESTQKFYEVFKGLEQEATREAQILEKQFGASERSAKSMLSMTGDLLTGFGFSREEALKLSAQVAQLGSDVASFSNYAGGAEGATQAITKAMLGETEQAKMLGIAIKTDSEEYKELYNRIKEANGTTDTQTKALTALQIAFQQKGTAMGDFERNITSIANRGRLLENQLENLRTNIGKVFAEDYSSGQQLFIDLLKTFNDLKGPQQEFVVKTGLIAAGLLAVKTSLAGYNLLSGIAAATSAKNAVAVTQEAAAHTANAAAIAAENAAQNAASGGSFASERALKQNRADIVAAKHAVQMAKLNGAEAKTVDALNAKYRQLLITRRELYKQHGVEVAQRSMVALGNSIDTVNTHVARMNRSLVATGSAAVLGKVKAGMLGVVTATRTATVAALGLAKAFLPMLAISGAIAGIDYLINRNKRAAEARNEYNDSLVAGAQRAVEAEKKQQAADNATIASLQAMSKYSKLTTEEQGKARDMIQQVAGRYEGLADQIKIVNGQLVIAKGAWEKVTEAQRKNYLSGLESQLAASKKSTSSQIEGYFGTFGRNLLDVYADATGKEGKYTIYDEMQKALQYQDAAIRNAIVTEAYNIALKKGYKDQAEYLKGIVDSLGKELSLEKEIIAAGKGSVATSGVGNMEQTKEYTKAVEALKQRRKADQWAGFSDSQKLAELAKQEKDLLDKRNAAWERSGDRIQAIQYSEQLLDIEKQRAEIMRAAEDKRAAELQRTAEQEMSFYMQMLNSVTRLRETARSGIEANSMEGLQMQSRRMGSGAGLQAAAKMTADASKQAAEAAKKSSEILAKMEGKQQEIYNYLQKIGVSSM